MARPKMRRTMTRFRVLLMLALIGAVGLLTALYRFGAAGAPRPRRARSDTPPFEEGTRMVGKDFDYTFSQGEKSVFRIRGESVRVDKDDTVYLQTVGLTLFDKEGRQFDAESDEASLNRTTNEGRLWGDVSIKGPSQLEIYSKELLIQEKGNLLITPGVARILYAGKYFARCDTSQAWLPDEVYSMIGNVRIETFPEVKPPLKLEAEKAIYERKRRQLRVEEDVELHRGPAMLDADRMTGLLSEDESSLTFVRAMYHVSGETAENEAPGTTKTTWEGNDLAVMLTPKGSLVRQIDLEGEPDKPASLHSAGNGVTRNLVAPHIIGVLADKDVLRSAEAYTGVDVEEIGPPPAAPGGAAGGARPTAPGAPGATHPAGAGATTPAAKPAATGRAQPAPHPPHPAAPSPPPGNARAAAAGGAGGAPPRPPGAAGEPAKSARAAAPAGGGKQPAGGKQAAAKPEPEATVRHARGQHADATFRTDGQIATVTMVDQVTYSDGEVNAAGDRAALDMDAGRGDFFGKPVHIVSTRGEMVAPHVIYTSADQLVHAVDGVRGQIQQANDANLTGSVLGEGKGPVMVQSAEAYWQRPQASFIFRGDVRAWRGDNLLLAPEVQGERLAQGDQLTAIGGVKSVWVSSQEEKQSAKQAAGSGRPAETPAKAKAAEAPAAAEKSAKAAAPAAGSASPAAHTGGGGPITVLAATLLYRDGTGLLTYTGNVHVDQDGKTLTCRQLDVNLDQDHKAKQMTCTGGTHLDDPAAGRKIDGDTGVYRLDTRKIDVFGEPVVMHDRDGSLVHGKRLRYALDGGKVEVLGKDEVKPPAPAATASPGTSPTPATPAAASTAVPPTAPTAPAAPLPAVPGSPATAAAPELATLPARPQPAGGWPRRGGER